MSNPQGVIPKVTVAMQEFFYNGQTGGEFYLESVATAVLAQIIYRRSNISGRLKRPPEFLDPNLLKSALEYIRTHLSQELNLNQIAATVGFSPSCRFLIISWLNTK
ncbi:MAG: hypothetical protein V7K41_31780 [Nostoc sp.]|uniref:hypothetical protein n=1 Tax=Nostoc sp. TaxID=1180 RepID=UPI002FF7D804